MTLSLSVDVPIAELPADIAISPDGTCGYVCHGSAGTISVIELPGLTVTGTITVPGTDTSIGRAVPFAAAFAPDGRRAYVVGIIDHGLQVIDTATHTVTEDRLTGPVRVGSPLSVVVTADGRTAYVTDPNAGGVQPIDLDTFATVLPQLNADDTGPVGLALTPDGKLLFAMNEGCMIVPVDLQTSKFLRPPIVINCEPSGLAVLPGGSRMLVANHRALLDEGDSSFQWIDVASRTLIGREIHLGLTDGARITGMALSPDGETVYLARTNREAGIGRLSALPTSALSV